ncbi:MAG: B12-binding domain-containing radical SAM protein [Promethearchaeota archaeon]
MRFLLIYPRFKYPAGDPPIGVISLMAYVRQELVNLEYRLFDATFNPSFDEIEKIIAEFKPDVTGIYCSTLMFDDVLKISIFARKQGSFTVIGGPHATVAPESLLCKKYVDAVIIGEGELPLVYLLRNYPDREKMGENPAILLSVEDALNDDAKEIQLIDDLETLPFPAYDLLDMEKYFNNWFQMDVASPTLRGTNFFASRGCPFHCSFCQPTLNSIFGKKTRIRSPEYIINHIKYLENRYAINSFIVGDDTLTYNKSWLKSFCKLLISEGINMTWGCNTRVGLIDEETMKLMSASGYRRMMVGIESANQRILDDIYQKGIKITRAPAFFRLAKKYHVRIFAYFMLGAPTESLKEIKRTIDFAFTQPIDEATFSITTPLPKTYLAKMMEERGFKIDPSYSTIDYYRGISSNKDLTIKKLRFLQKYAFFKFYIHPRRWRLLFNSFGSIRGIRKTLLKLKRLFSF